MKLRWKWLTQDLSLKIFSICLAIIFFLLISKDNSSSIYLDFFIEYRLAPGMMITSEAPSTIHTTLQGPRSTFRILYNNTNNLEPVIIDLTHGGPGTLKHTVQLSEIHPPSGLKIISLNPAVIEVTLDRRVEKQIAVSADISTPAKTGYTLLDVNIKPERIPVIGPLSKMEGLDFIYTKPIDIRTLDGNTTLDVDLKAPAPPFKIQQKQVQVNISIKANPESAIKPESKSDNKTSEDILKLENVKPSKRKVLKNRTP